MWAVLVVTLSTSFVMGVNIGGPNDYNSVSLLFSLCPFNHTIFFSSLFHGQEDIRFHVKKMMIRQNGWLLSGGVATILLFPRSIRRAIIIYRQCLPIERFGKVLSTRLILFVLLLVVQSEV